MVGERKETMKESFRILDKNLSFETKVWARIRNLGELVEVESLSSSSSGKVEVKLKEKIFGVAEGQSCVFYDETQVLVAGSIIV
mgnify:FL=1